MPLHLVEGHTDPIIDQLLLDGQATESLAGHAVECLLRDNNGAVVAGAGTSAIHDAATRKVRFTPAAGILLNAKSPYAQRWRVTRPGGEVYFVPSDEPEIWVVNK